MDYELIRSKRKTVALSVSKQCKVLVKAPLKMPAKEIERFVAKHTDWIERQMLRMQERSAFEQTHRLTKEQTEELRCKAKLLIPQRVEYYARMMGVTPTGVKITRAVTRWGSCNSKNSLCFSHRLMLLPMELIDLIVVHELAHIRVKNHSKQFYLEMEQYLPDYRNRMKLLKEMQKHLPVEN